MKIANIIFLFLLLTFTFLSSIYGISPKLNSELLNNKIERLITYSPNESYNKSIALETDINLEEVYVTSNGTHIEIKLLFDDLLNNLKNILLNSSTVPHNFFINIFIDSDDDENTGFLGYNHRYFFSHNVSDSYEDDNNNNLTSATKKNLLQTYIYNYSKEDEILENEELAEIIARTLNSKDILEKLNWVVKGYEILDHDFQPLFFSSKVNEKYLSAIPDGFKVTLDLAQIGYPSNYALLVEVGRKSEDYKLSNIFGKIHLPRPDLTINDKTIDIEKGRNSEILEFNNTGLYDLNVKAELLNKSRSNDGLVINFSQGNQFGILDGNGVLPMEITANSNYKQKNLVIPLNLSYNVIGENDFTESDINNSLTHEHIYNKIVYLNFKFQERIPLINVEEIPSQYIAVFLGAIFTFFIPSIARLTKEYFQKRTAHKYLKVILKEQNLSDNPDISIKNIMSNLRIIKHEFIKGNITKDQYEILKENIADILKDLISKKTSDK